MAYATQNWHARAALMGDPSEEAFLAMAADLLGLPAGADATGLCERTGICRPPQSLLRALPRRLRNMPDYRTPLGWVECKGMGRDQILKVKVDQWADLVGHYDDNEYPLWFFIWDSHKKRHFFLRATVLRDILNSGVCVSGTFSAKGEPSKMWIGWPAKALPR